MTADQLKELEDTLWQAADKLRVDSGLKASEYATPILGLIFLRFASLRYNRIKPEIDAEIKAQKNSRLQQSEAEIAIAKCGLPVPILSIGMIKATFQKNISWKLQAMNCYSF